MSLCRLPLHGKVTGGRRRVLPTDKSQTKGSVAAELWSKWLRHCSLFKPCDCYWLAVVSLPSSDSTAGTVPAISGYSSIPDFLPERFVFGKQRLFIVCETELGKKERCTSLMNGFSTGKVRCDLLFMRAWQMKQSGMCVSANTLLYIKVSLGTEGKHINYELAF